MEKLIITATCDSTMSYPSNPYNPQPKGVDAVVAEYVRCADAGAAISHLHGPYVLDEKIQADGTKLADLDIDAWGRLRNGILDQRDTIIQYGVANGRFEDRKLLVKNQHPDMLSTNFSAHDECFDNEPGNEPVEQYSLHRRDELIEYCEMANANGIKIEVESFHFGSIWNAMRLRDQGYIKGPIWTTFFLGWKGGAWTPPTPHAMLYMADHCPADFNWNTSVMNPEEQWKILSMAIMLGGHVRVGMEDNPFVTPGEYATTNAQLVEKIVRIARDLGREIATPEEARQIIQI